MKCIAIIPARGGSKGIPKKNIKDLGGVPLIKYTLDAALQVFRDTEIIVSTDDVSIKEVVEMIGVSVPFIRPKHLATDTAGTYEVLLHALNYYESKYGFVDVLVLLQPTSPFRTAEHIREAVSIYENEKKKPLDMVVSVCKSESNPYYNLFEEDNVGYLKTSKKGDFTRRQDCPPVFEYNGAIYVINKHSLRKGPINKFSRIRKYEMSNRDSIDIDTPIDWTLAELILQQNNTEKAP